MRSNDEIVMAHDRLIAVILGEAPNPFANENSMEHLKAACDVLCWVLGHDHNQSFGHNLEMLANAHSELGYKLIDREN